MKKKLRKRNINFEKVFNADQQKFMTNYNHRGSLSAQTINKALKLYVACGRKGYEEVQRQNLPYPSIRTLQYRIQSLKFGPGILEDILQLLKMKVSIVFHIFGYIHTNIHIYIIFIYFYISIVHFN